MTSTLLAVAALTKGNMITCTMDTAHGTWVGPLTRLDRWTISNGLLRMLLYPLPQSSALSHSFVKDDPQARLRYISEGDGFGMPNLDGMLRR